ncbi:MAG: ATP phosphoribosyltransferase [Synergistaceae bacterium]|jgi:ATP phosphoribosyltransferase|nr:ATP phosphoribosyltransferase [Synergistaceae bacterium]
MGLTVALTKGRLADKAIDLFVRAGVICPAMKETMGEAARRLIFSNEDAGLSFFMAKAPDVPTYVDYGAADVGIAGKDTLLEGGRHLYEVLDLKFGVCKMVVAGYEKTRDRLRYGNNLRVATKYPHIALDYFSRRKQQTVEIVKLNGSVELAPIIGLADVIVDIVESGVTLAENGLSVLEEITSLSARMVVNRASMKMRRSHVAELIKKLKHVLTLEDTLWNAGPK